MVGLGAAALTKFCFKKLRMATTAIEINPQVVAVCRQWFKLPSDSARLRVLLAELDWNWVQSVLDSNAEPLGPQGGERGRLLPRNRLVRARRAGHHSGTAVAGRIVEGVATQRMPGHPEVLRAEGKTVLRNAATALARAAETLAGLRAPLAHGTTLHGVQRLKNEARRERASRLQTASMRSRSMPSARPTSRTALRGR